MRLNLDRLADGPALPLLIAAAGVAERIGWNALRPTAGASGEAEHVAVAIGSGRGFADAYQIGQGATAHLLPISPGIGGAVYRVLGVQTIAAEAVLATWSIALAIGTYALLFRAFGRLGTPRWARLAAFAAGCLAPTYVSAEAVDFRVWEGGLAAFLAAVLLDRLIAHEQAEGVSDRSLLVDAALCALLFFVNPPVGLAACAGAAIFCLRRLPFRRTLMAGAASALMLAALLVPWTLRNARELGHPVLLRSNAGLELALAQYPGALHPLDRRQAFIDRLGAIHPVTLPAFERMRASGGEVAYADGLGREAKGWMAAHPGQAVALVALHIRQTVVPQRWQFNVFGTTLSPTLRAGIAQIVGVAGLIGLALALADRRRGWVYPAVLLGVVTVLASPFQPVTRYTYLLYPTMLFCAGELVGRWRRRTPAAP